jgi:hypothetical protein
VNLGSESETPPSVAAIEADAAEPFLLRELADGNLERLRSVVESQRDLPLDCG